MRRSLVEKMLSGWFVSAPISAVLHGVFGSWYMWRTEKSEDLRFPAGVCGMGWGIALGACWPLTYTTLGLGLIADTVADIDVSMLSRSIKEKLRGDSDRGRDK